MRPTFLRGAESEGATAAVHLSVGLISADRLSGFAAKPLPVCVPDEAQLRRSNMGNRLVNDPEVCADPLHPIPS